MADGLAMRVERRDLLRGTALLGLAAAAPAYARTAVTAPYPSVRRLIDRMIAEGAYPGAVAAVGSGAALATLVRGGTLAFDNRRRVDENTLWRIYSMTKPVTGMAAMLLIAEGKLKLDQPVADFIPAFANLRVLTNPAGSLESRPVERVMTIRHLLTHTSGLGGLGAAKSPLEAEYRKRGLTPGQRSRAEQQARAAVTAPSLKEFAERLASVPLIAEPGAKWSYSVSLDLLGRIIEIVSGVAFDEYLRRRFFVPLGMTSTFFRVPASAKARLATNYIVSGGKVVPIDPGATSVFLDEPSFPSGGGGLVSSARDYDRFLGMLANGGRMKGVTVMPPNAVALGMSNLLPEGANMRGYVGIPGVVGYGAGGAICNVGGFKHVYGWMGAAGTIGVIAPSHKLRITGLINNMSEFSFALRLAAAVHADLA